MEAMFRADHARKSARLVRGSLVLGVSQFVLFGLLDRVMIPTAYREIQLIRAVTVTLMLVCLALTFAPWFERRMQTVMVFPPLLAGFAVAVMAVVGQESSEYYHYYVGLILVLMYVHVLLRLSFVVASAVGNVLIAVFLATTAALGTPTAALWNTAFFVLSANATGMIASYALERYARQAFYQQRQQQRTNTELAAVLEGLRTAQARLIQQEKMASLGRLTAGVAHEIKNPLNFVNNFAGLTVDLADELARALERGGAADRPPPELLADLRQNVTKIRDHGQRADRIVRGMLEHAGATRGAKRSVDLNRLVGEQADLALEAFRGRHPGFAPALTVDPDPAAPPVAAIPREIERVVASLVDNALIAVLERAAAAEPGGDGAAYVPSVTVRTRHVPAGDGPEAVRVEVEDNGVGIPGPVRDRVFEPFFTTRPAGSGTGLALSLSYEFVVQSHGGTLTFESEPGKGTTFVMTLPVSGAVADASPAVTMADGGE
jgi:signal transduction histidine kinase